MSEIQSSETAKGNKNIEIKLYKIKLKLIKKMSEECGSNIRLK